MIADKAYSYPSTRQALRARQIAFTCPERSDQIARRHAQGSAGGRPPAFGRDIYRRRNVVERCSGRLKQFRGLATRDAKRLAYYRAEVVIATISLWLRDSQDTYVFADATYLKGRVRGRVVSRAVVVATGVTSSGDREVLGVEVGDGEEVGGVVVGIRARRVSGEAGQGIRREETAGAQVVGAGSQPYEAVDRPRARSGECPRSTTGTRRRSDLDLQDASNHSSPRLLPEPSLTLHAP